MQIIVCMVLLLTSVLRKWETHGPRYLKCCNQLNIAPVAAAKEDDAASGGGQGTLDGFVQPSVSWSKGGLLDHVVQLVVSDDQV